MMNNGMSIFVTNALEELSQLQNNKCEGVQEEIEAVEEAMAWLKKEMTRLQGIQSKSLLTFCLDNSLSNKTE